MQFSLRILNIIICKLLIKKKIFTQFRNIIVHETLSNSYLKIWETLLKCNK